MTRSADRSRSAAHRPSVTTRIGTTTRPRRASLGALAATAVLLAACGGGDGGEEEAAGNPNDPRNSPVAQLLGFDMSSSEQRAKDLEIQQQIAECMRDEGWEYEPVDYQAQMGDMNAEWEQQLNDPEGYGEKYGYGVVRSYESQGDMSGTTFEDPNQDYLETLTPEENQAYYETLYGVQPEFVEGDEYVMPPLEDQGCQGAAMLAVYGENSAMTNADLQTRLNELFTESENDPALAQANDDWAACMRERDPSYEFERPDEASSQLWERLNELQGFGSMPEGGDDGVVVEGTVASSDFGGPTEIDEADLEELRQDELRTWRDDWDCQQEVDIAGIRRDVEQRIVDDLLAEFPELEASS